MISMNAELQTIYSQEFVKGSSGTPLPAARYVRFGMFHLDLRREELLKDGTRVKLQGKVYLALLALIERPGEVVTRETLRLRLWPADTHVNYDANVNTTVNKLRQVLGDSPEQPIFVDTIPRKGYSFVAKIEYLDQPAEQQLPKEQLEGLALAPSPDDGSRVKGLFSPVALSSKWFTAGVISLVVAGMLFGAALMLYAYRSV
jgi:DNA-binding winged helix-turn-helix (wHTH) protein